MDIIVVASNETRLEEIVDTIEHSVQGTNIHAYTDPMLAIQYLYQHSADYVFADTNLKHLTAVQFVQMARKKQPDLDISIMLDESQHDDLFLTAGAKRVVGEDVPKDVFKDIVTNSHNNRRL